MTPEAERTRAALAALVQVLEATASDAAALAERSRGLQAEFVRGRRLAELVPQEPRPLIVARVSELLERLAEAGAALRRTEARQLVAEGMTQAQVAELFGVTRQRVAALLSAERPQV